MCGLLGFSTTSEDQVISADLSVFIFNQMMRMNDLRGGDSFGFSLVQPAKKSIEHFKIVGKCGTQQSDKRLKKGLDAIIGALTEKGRGPVIVMGHNRKATTGEISIRNQHPFEFGKPHKKGPWVLGAHNGMLWGYQEAIEYWDIKRKVEVDSEVIFRGLMNKDAPEETLGLLIPIGSMALTYMRNDWTRLNLFSGDNPLNVAHLPGVMFWSSEYRHLSEALFGLSSTSASLQKDKIFSIDVATNKVVEVTGVRPNTALVGDKYTSTFGQTAQWRGASRLWNQGPPRLPFGPSKQSSSLVDEMLAEDRANAKNNTKPSVDIKNITPTHSAADFDEEMIFYGDIDRVTVPTANAKDTDLVTCCTCDLKQPKDTLPAMVQPCSLIWYDGDCYCGTCYHWMVMSIVLEE